MARGIVPLVTLSFITLHSPDHKPIELNAAEVSSLREPSEGRYGAGVKCVVVMTNRSFIGVSESCPSVHQLLSPPTVGHAPCTLVCAGTERP